LQCLSMEGALDPGLREAAQKPESRSRRASPEGCDVPSAILGIVDGRRVSESSRHPIRDPTRNTATPVRRRSWPQVTKEVPSVSMGILEGEQQLDRCPTASLASRKPSGRCPHRTAFGPRAPVSRTGCGAGVGGQRVVRRHSGGLTMVLESERGTGLRVVGRSRTRRGRESGPHERPQR